MKTLIVFAAVIATGYAAVTALNWQDCASSTNTAITVHQLSISPIPITFPGNITVSLNATVNRKIDHLFVDVELNRKTSLFGSVKVPCVAGTNIGSCQNIDACSILTDILSGSSVVSQDLGKQLETILLSALGHQPQCPVQPESVAFAGRTLQLSAIPQALSTIADGDYHIKIMIKDDPTSAENVGCLEFDAGLARAKTGFLFG